MNDEATRNVFYTLSAHMQQLMAKQTFVTVEDIEHVYRSMGWQNLPPPAQLQQITYLVNVANARPLREEKMEETAPQGR